MWPRDSQPISYINNNKTFILFYWIEVFFLFYVNIWIVNVSFLFHVTWPSESLSITDTIPSLQYDTTMFLDISTDVPYYMFMVINHFLLISAKEFHMRNPINTNGKICVSISLLIMQLQISQIIALTKQNNVADVSKEYWFWLVNY